MEIPPQVLRAAGVMLMIAAVVGCGGDQPVANETIERPGQPPVTQVESDDPEMTAAIETARATVDQFIAALETPQPSRSDFSVKVRIEDGDYAEHMWILPVRYENGEFHGTINNEPSGVTTVSLGDEVSVAKEEISDWMYVEDQKLIGGYTLRAIRASLPQEERADFDRSLPFALE